VSKSKIVVAGCDVSERAEIASTLESRGFEVEFAETRRAQFSGLTGRERQVLDLIVMGHGNKTVAQMLSISPRTVENHRAQIMRKTMSRNVAALVHLALSREPPQ
jgi:FixJ family two-component response regulator